MKLRLPHKFQAALLAAIASVSFTTLSSGTLAAAFFLGNQAFADEAADEPTATIDIGDTNLDSQAAMDEEEGKGEAKEPGSTPINRAGFNGMRGSSDDADRNLDIGTSTDVTSAMEVTADSTGGANQVGTASSAALPSDDLGFTATPYAESTGTQSNGSEEVFEMPAPATTPVADSQPQASQTTTTSSGTGTSFGSAVSIPAAGGGAGAIGGYGSYGSIYHPVSTAAAPATQQAETADTTDTQSSGAEEVFQPTPAATATAFSGDGSAALLRSTITATPALAADPNLSAAESGISTPTPGLSTPNLDSMAAAEETPLTFGADLGKVMYVGDSITDGVTRQPSWRYAFFKILADEGIGQVEEGYYQHTQTSGAITTTTYGGRIFENIHSAKASARSYEAAGTRAGGRYDNSNIKNWLGQSSIKTNNQPYNGPVYKEENAPDTFFMLLGTNDLLSEGGENNHVTENSYNSVMSSMFGYSGGSYDGTSGTFDKILASMLEANPKAKLIILEMPTWSPSRSGNHDADTDFQYLARFNQTLGGWVTSKNNANIQLINPNVGMTDVANTTKPGAGVAYMFINDGLHPSNQGELIIAGNVAKAMGYGGRTAGMTRVAATDTAKFTFSDANVVQTLAGGSAYTHEWQGTPGSYTVDFSSLVLGNGAVDSWKTGSSDALSISVGNGSSLGILTVDEAYIKWNGNVLYSYDMSTNTDSLRIAYYKAGNAAELATTPSGYYVWLGDMLIGEGLGTSSGSAVNGLSITAGSGVDTGALTLGTVSMAGEAYAPALGTGHYENADAMYRAISVVQEGSWANDGTHNPTDVATGGNNIYASTGGGSLGDVFRYTEGNASSWFGAKTGADATGNFGLQIKGASGGGATVFGAVNANTVTGNVYVELDAVNATYGSFSSTRAGSVIGSFDSTITNTFTGVVNAGTLNNDVYGGIYQNNSSKYIGSTDIYVNGGTLKGSVYGGGYGGSIGTADSGYTDTVAKVTITDGSIAGSVYGGGGSGSTETIKGGTEVHIHGGAIAGSVYGGGAGGTVMGNSSVEISYGRIGGDIFGGANGGTVQGDTSVTISGGYLSGNIYGNNRAASIGERGTVTFLNLADDTLLTTLEGYKGTVTASTVVLDNFTISRFNANLVTETLHLTNNSSTVLTNLTLTACEVVIDAGSDLTLDDTLNLGNTATFSGNLTLADSLKINISSAGMDKMYQATGMGYYDALAPDSGNGFRSGSGDVYVIKLADSATGTLSADETSVRANAQGSFVTMLNEGVLHCTSDSIYVSLSAAGTSDYFVRNGSVVYNDTAASSIGTAGKIYLFPGENGATLVMKDNLDTSVCTGGVEVAAAGGTILLGDNVVFNAANLTASAAVTLTSSKAASPENMARFALASSATALPANVQLADDWTGAVRLTGSVNGININPFANANSWVEFNGFSGYTSDWYEGTGNGVMAQNIYLTNGTNGYAWLANGNTSNPGHETRFTGKIAGDGTLKTQGTNLGYKFSGDISGWNGTLQVNGGTPIVTFAGNAKEVNADIEAISNGSINLKVETDATFNGNISGVTNGLSVANGHHATFNGTTSISGASAIGGTVYNDGTMTLGGTVAVNAGDLTAYDLYEQGSSEVYSGAAGTIYAGSGYLTSNSKYYLIKNINDGSLTNTATTPTAGVTLESVEGGLVFTSGTQGTVYYVNNDLSYNAGEMQNATSFVVAANKTFTAAGENFNGKGLVLNEGSTLTNSKTTYFAQSQISNLRLDGNATVNLDGKRISVQTGGTSYSPVEIALNGNTLNVTGTGSDSYFGVVGNATVDAGTIALQGTTKFMVGHANKGGITVNAADTLMTMANGTSLVLANGNTITLEGLNMVGSGTPSASIAQDGSSTAGNLILAPNAGEEYTFNGTAQLSSLTLDGEGTQVIKLTNDNSNLGAVTVNSGTLKIASKVAQTTNVTVNSGATLAIDGRNNTDYKMRYTLAGGTLANTGENTGSSSVQNDQITLTADSTISGTGNFYMLAGDYGATSLNLATQTLHKTGSNTVILYNTAVTKGTLDVQQGTIDFSTDHNIDRVAADIAFNGGNVTGSIQMTDNIKLTAKAATASSALAVNTDNYALTLDGTGNLTLSGVISGSGSVTKTGDGTVTLSGANTYSGGTTVNGGKLVVNHANALGTGLVNVSGGATLELTSQVSSINGNVTIHDGNTFKLAGADMLTVNGLLTLEAGATLDLANIFASPVQQPVKLAAAKSGGAVEPAAGATYVLATANEIDLASSGINLQNLADGYRGTLSTQAATVGSGKELILTLAEPSKNLIWDNNAQDNKWDVATTLNWHTSASTETHLPFATGDNVTFTSGVTNSPVLQTDIEAGTMTLTNGASTVTINTNDHNLTVDNLVSADAATDNKFTKTGAGTATFNGNSTVYFDVLSIGADAGTTIFNQHVVQTGNTRFDVSSDVSFLNGYEYTGTQGYGLLVTNSATVTLGGESNMPGKKVGMGSTTANLILEENASLSVLAFLNTVTSDNNGNLTLKPGASLTVNGGEYRAYSVVTEGTILVKNANTTRSRMATLTTKPGSVSTFQCALEGHETQGEHYGISTFNAQGGSVTFEKNVTIKNGIAASGGVLTTVNNAQTLNLPSLTIADNDTSLEFSGHVVVTGNNRLNVGHNNNVTGNNETITFNDGFDYTGADSTGYALLIGKTDTVILGGTSNMSGKIVGMESTGTLRLLDNATVTVARMYNSITAGNNGKLDLQAGTKVNITGSSGDSTITDVTGTGAINYTGTDNRTLKLDGDIHNYTGTLDNQSSAVLTLNLDGSATAVNMDITHTGSGTVNMTLAEKEFTLGGTQEVNNITQSTHVATLVGNTGHVTATGRVQTGRLVVGNTDKDAGAVFTLSGSNAMMNKSGSEHAYDGAVKGYGTFEVADGATQALSNLNAGDNAFHGTLKATGENSVLTLSGTLGSGADLYATGGGKIALTSTVTSADVVTIDSNSTLVLARMEENPLSLTSLTLKSGSILDLVNFTGATGAESITLATTTNGISGDLSGVTLSNWTDPTGYTSSLVAQDNNLVLTFTPQYDGLIWDGGAGTWDIDTTKHWHKAGESTGSSSFAQNSDVKFEKGVSTATLGGNITADTMTLEKDAVVKVDKGDYTFSATLAGEGTYVLPTNTTTLGEGVSLGTDWDGIVRLSSTSEQKNVDIRPLATEDSWVEFNGFTGYTNSWATSAGGQYNIEFSQNVILTNPDDSTPAYTFTACAGTLYTMYATGDWKGNGEFRFSGVTQQGVKFTGDISGWDGKLTSQSTGTRTVTFAGEADEVNVQIANQDTGTLNVNINNDNDVTLTGDITKTNGTLNLNVGNTSATDATFSGTITGANLNVGANSTATISHTSNVGNVTGTGTVVVSNGTTLTVGSSTGDFTNVTVNSGATLDLNGAASTDYKMRYTLAGGTLTNTGSNTGGGSIQNDQITLTANSTISGSSNFYMLGDSYGKTELHLDTHTLEKTGTNEITMYSTEVSGGGTLKITNGSLNITRRSTDKPMSSVNANIELNKGGSETLTGNFNLDGGHSITSTVSDARMTANVGMQQGATTLSAGAGSSLTASGILSGAGTLIKSGEGVLNLTGANTFTGGVSITAGTVNANNATALGNGLVTVSGGTLSLGQAVDTLTSDLLVESGATLKLNEMGGSAVSITGTLGLDGGSTLDLSALSISGTEIGPITLMKGGTINQSYLSNVIVDFGKEISQEYTLDVQDNNLVLTFTQPDLGLIWDATTNNEWSTDPTDFNWHNTDGDPGTAAFTANSNVTFESDANAKNTAALQEDITAGAMNVQSGANVTVETNDHNLYAGINVAQDASVTFKTSGTQTDADTITGTITGAGDIYKDGAGTLVLNPSSNTNTGDLIINNGTVKVSNAGALGTQGNRDVVVNTGGTLAFEAGSTQYEVDNLTLNPGSTLTFSGAVATGQDPLLNIGSLTLASGASVDLSNITLDHTGTYVLARVNSLTKSEDGVVSGDLVQFIAMTGISGSALAPDRLVSLHYSNHLLTLKLNTPTDGYYWKPDRQNSVWDNTYGTREGTANWSKTGPSGEDNVVFVNTSSAYGTEQSAYFLDAGTDNVEDITVDLIGYTQGKTNTTGYLHDLIIAGEGDTYNFSTVDGERVLHISTTSLSNFVVRSGAEANFNGIQIDIGQNGVAHICTNAKATIKNIYEWNAYSVNNEGTYEVAFNPEAPYISSLMGHVDNYGTMSVTTDNLGQRSMFMIGEVLNEAGATMTLSVPAIQADTSYGDQTIHNEGDFQFGDTKAGLSGTISSPLPIVGNGILRTAGTGITVEQKSTVQQDKMVLGAGVSDFSAAVTIKDTTELKAAAGATATARFHAGSDLGEHVVMGANTTLDLDTASQAVYTMGEVHSATAGTDQNLIVHSGVTANVDGNVSLPDGKAEIAGGGKLTIGGASSTVGELAATGSNAAVVELNGATAGPDDDDLVLTVKKLSNAGTATIQVVNTDAASAKTAQFNIGDADAEEPASSYSGTLQYGLGAGAESGSGMDLVIKDDAVTEGAVLEATYGQGTTGSVNVIVDTAHAKVVGLTDNISPSDANRDMKVSGATAGNSLEITGDGNYSYAGKLGSNLDIAYTGSGSQTIEGGVDHFNGSITVDGTTDSVLALLKAASVEVTDVTLGANDKLGVYKDSTATGTGDVTMTDGHTLKAGQGAAMDAVLEMESGSTLDVSASAGTAGLLMGGSVTLHEGVTLSNSDMEKIMGMSFMDSYDLFSGVQAFSYDGSEASEQAITFTSENWVKASDVFSNSEFTGKDYYVFYSGTADGGKGGNVGAVYIMQIPEPTTGTLSLLALAALAARRRRK